MSVRLKSSHLLRDPFSCRISLSDSDRDSRKAAPSSSSRRCNCRELPSSTSFLKMLTQALMLRSSVDDALSDRACCDHLSYEFDG